MGLYGENDWLYRLTRKNYCTTPACVMTAATILNYLDKTVDPCEDFYEYACGGWIKSHSLPEDVVMFSKMTKRLADNFRIFKYLLEDESFELKGETERNVRILYHSCLNTTRIEELGAQPLLDLLKKIGGWNISGDFNINDWDFQKALDLINNNNLASSFFGWVIMADLKNSSRNSLVVQQTELTLDSRDYYLNKTMDDKKPKSTVSNVIVKWKRRGSETSEKRTGRPKILGERSRRSLKRVMKQNRNSSLVEISQEFQSSSGIRNAKHRLQWCRAHRHWTVNLWKNVLWSDESRFTVRQSDGRVWVWRVPGEHFFSDYIVPTVKGWWKHNGVGVFLVVWSGSVNSCDWKHELLDICVPSGDNAALPTLWRYFGESPFLFQQDNCYIHTSRLAQTWFDEMGVQKLDWPSQCLDLNPIEKTLG
ncbi:endothelin-converting enzyme homolog [Trichonephila clavipes]|nr:endothelin-converting enzyme homolog [Trichonephila clavipes]